jgi:hypothetical protein
MFCYSDISHFAKVFSHFHCSPIFHRSRSCQPFFHCSTIFYRSRACQPFSTARMTQALYLNHFSPLEILLAIFPLLSNFLPLKILSAIFHCSRDSSTIAQPFSIARDPISHFPLLSNFLPLEILSAIFHCSDIVKWLSVEHGW